MTVLLSTVNGTELRAKESTYALLIGYIVDPPYLPSYCDGRREFFSICHVLESKKYCLIYTWHTELRDGVFNLTRKAL